MVAGPGTQGNENANWCPWPFCRPCQVELLKAIREQRQQMDLKDEQLEASASMQIQCSKNGHVPSSCGPGSGAKKKVGSFPRRVSKVFASRRGYRKLRNLIVWV